MTRLLYNLLFPLAFLAVLPRYLARMFKRGGFREDFGQRFARYAPEHPREIAREDDEKGEGKKKIVKKADHSWGSRL